MIPVDPTPGSDSWWTERLTWCERLERTMADYGVRESQYTWADFTDWERSPGHSLATIF